MVLQTLQCVWIMVIAHGTGTGSYELGWSIWSSCSVSCGMGVKHKTRTCIIPYCPKKEMSRTLISQCYNPCPTDSKPKNVSEAQPTIKNEEDETLSPFYKGKIAATTKKMIFKPTRRPFLFRKRGKRSSRRQKKPKTSKSTTAAATVSTTINSNEKPTQQSTGKNVTYSSNLNPTPSHTAHISSKSLPVISATAATTTITSFINGQTSRPALQSTAKHTNPTPKTTVSYNEQQSSTLKVTSSPPGEQYHKTKRKTKFTKPTISNYKNTPSTKIATNGVGTCMREDHKHIWWPETKAGEIAIGPCPPNSKGTASRMCLKENKVKWSKVNLAKCVSTVFLKIQEQLKELQSCGNSSHSKCIVRSSYREVIEILVNATAPKDNAKRLNGGDLVISINSLASIHNTSLEFNSEMSKSFVNIVSNLLSNKNIDTWRQTQKEYQRNLALEVATLMENIGFSISKNLSSKSNTSILISAGNVVMKVDHIGQQLKYNQRDIHFKFSNTSVQVPIQELFENNSSKLVTIIYLNLNNVLQFKSNGKHPLNKREDLWSSTAIISSSVFPRKRCRFKRPIKMIMKNVVHYPKDGANITCVSWTPGTSKEEWSRDGCRLVPEESGQDVTTCICYHMTLFAALMDPYGSKITKEHRIGLEIISLAGCSISLIAVTVTFAITLFHWKKLKSPRSEILLNMCLAIGVVCILVIIESPARENKAVCSIIATLLHFFLLSIFSWMLCEGLLLRLVFFSDITGSGRSKLKQFYILGWGFPAMIVSISLGATQMDGYGEKNVLCWLSTKNGLSFAFVAPAVFIVLVNTWILVLTMRRMLRIRQIKNKPKVERLRLGLRAAFVILPLLGVTWLFGLLAFDSNTIVFKYLFAVFNSLQGVFIFIFHCILDNKVKEAIRHRQRRRQSMAMSVSRVRPVDKDRGNSNPSAPLKMFSFAKTSVKKDVNKQWSEASDHQKTRVTKIVHVQETSAKCFPKSLQMSSLVFEMTIEEHKQGISNHDDVL